MTGSPLNEKIIRYSRIADFRANQSRWMERMRVLYFLVVMGLLFGSPAVTQAASTSTDSQGWKQSAEPIKQKRTRRKPGRYSHKKSKSTTNQRAARTTRPRLARAASYHPSSAPIIGAYALRDELSGIIDTHLSNADVGVYVKSMKHGDVLYEYNIYEPMTPASTMKVITAEAALLYLGPTYRFTTQLLTDATGIKSGVLQGNLYIVLSGDPSLKYEDLAGLMASLQSHGVSAIRGNVYIDSTAYDQRFYGPGWHWDDKNYCYAAPIGASIIDHNCIPFKVAPSSVTGGKATVVKSSKYFLPGIRNSVVTKSTRGCGLKLSTSSNSIIDLDGCMRKGRSGLGLTYVVADIPEYNRALFKSLLKQMDIDVYGNVTFGTASKTLSLMGKHESEPLRDLVKKMLKKSDNIIAGAVFKKLGQLYTGKPGSWENGSVAVANILSNKIGMSKSGLRLLDGSGLSPDNLASPSQLMQVLEYAFRHDHISTDFITSLPISGVDGTLKHRLANIARRVRAKTGTISGVASLAGYVMTVDKEPLAFVIMINGAKAYGWQYKATEDKIATALSRYRRGG